MAVGWTVGISRRSQVRGFGAIIRERGMINVPCPKRWTGRAARTDNEGTWHLGRRMVETETLRRLMEGWMLRRDPYGVAAARRSCWRAMPGMGGGHALCAGAGGRWDSVRRRGGGWRWPERKGTGNCKK